MKSKLDSVMGRLGRLCTEEDDNDNGDRPRDENEHEHQAKLFE